MAKQTWNDPISMNVDWGGDENTGGLPVSGAMVQKFIKDSLNTKHGASYFEPTTNTMLYFASKDDLAEWLTSGDSELIIDEVEMNFTGTMYQVKVVSEMPSKTLYFTTQMEKAEITVSFLSQKKGITDASWQDIVEDYYVSVYIDKGGVGSYTPMLLDQFVVSGNTFTFDVRKVLATGTNRVRVVAVGTESGMGAQGSEVFIANLTSMYIAPSNFTWYKPFIEGETYSLGGVNIGGNLQKILKIRVSKEGYEKLYEINIGSDIYTTTAYTFQGMEFPEAGTGVYNVDMWLDANGLESDHLVYNIICVSEADKFTAQIVAIGDPAEVVYNFTDNVLFQYCVYNGGTASGTPHIRLVSLVNTNPTTLVDEDLVNVATASPLTYTASLEIEMEDESASLQLEAHLTYGNEQMIIFPVDNSKSYPATTGAVFYMNPSSRNNAQDNREKIINAVTSAEINAIFDGMAWTDGADGWTTDDEGRKCLRLPAMTSVEIEYQPLASVAQKTIEFVYKVKNAADYDEPIISICSDVTDPRFRGIKITPKNILLHSRDLNVEDELQDYNTTDEETLHVLITIIPNYKTNYGNLAQIYCNGSKVRSFSFETADRWDVTSNIKIGGQYTDIYIYKMRVYDRGFESYDALKNYVNSLATTAEKEVAMAKIEAPLDDSYKLSYDECTKNGLNTMVIEILDQDQTVPSIAHPSDKQCNLWIKINNVMDGELDEDFAYLFGGNDILNQTIEGQGTTAMTYARWNFRWKLGSAYNKRRITAKKNFASSMHSHKMGATRLFNDLNRKVVGVNDADARVAVYQYPVYGFQKVLIEGTSNQYMYEPIGLYTIGPDKGDKTTFGFNNENFESSLIQMEGTDHTPKGVGMDYPWDNLVYSGSAEGFGAVNASGGVVAAWEVGAAGDYDPVDNPTEVMAMLGQEFRPAYDVAYNNSTYIEGVTETLDEINADIPAWQARVDADGRSYSGLEFFTDGVYDLYFYNTQTQQYEPNGVNLRSELNTLPSFFDSMTVAEKTNVFKTNRRQRFTSTWGNYWDINDCVFHYTFMLLFGATDNFKKNTYPYKFKLNADGGKFRWRQDDLDTLFDINNQGLAAKAYSVLVGDKTSTGSGSIYRGDTSVFWTLIKETQSVAIKNMVHSIFNAMVELCPSGYGSNTLDKVLGCVRYYFWDKAQSYFPASSYNMDAEWTYEDTWAAGQYKEVNPLSQSLGGHYEAERDWVTMRILFTAMYYNYGPFGAVNDSFSDTSTGQIAYGGAGAHTFDIVMACDGNPTILRGQSELVTHGDRVFAGDTVSLTVPDSSGADTRIYVQGVDWMEDVGDLATLQVSADNATLSLSSKRMQNFKIGDVDASKVTTNVTGLTFGSCPSMMIVDARNVSTLGGNIDLTKMPRLLEAYFGGTNVRSVTIPNGSKITNFEVGDEITQLSLQNLKFINEEGFVHGTLPKLEFLRVENCLNLSPYGMLKAIYNLDGNVLRDIRVIGFDESGTWEDFEMIANLANDKDKDGVSHVYNGIDSEGKPIDNSYPVIEGLLRTDGNVFDDSYALITSAYPNLGMEFNELYLRIKDAEVLRILLANGVGDGFAVTESKADALTNIGTWFSENTVIQNFDELSKFKNIIRLEKNAFLNCTSLESIDLSNLVYATEQSVFDGCTSLAGDIYLPRAIDYLGYYFFRKTKIKSLTAPLILSIMGACMSECSDLEFADISGATAIHEQVFNKCTSLRSVVFGDVTTIGNSAFTSCTALAQEINLPNLSSLGSYVFYESGITGFSAPLVSTIQTAAFYNCPNLASIDLPSVTVIIANAFEFCRVLVSANIPNVERLENFCFSGCTSLTGDFNLPNLTSLGSYAFYQSSITSFEAPLLTAVSEACFRDCPNLASVDLPSATTIGAYAFQNCTSLTSVGDLSNVETMSYNVFYYCTELTGDINLAKLSGILQSYNFVKTKITSLNAPLVSTVNLQCCYDCSELTSVDFPVVTTINDQAFYNCTSLASINMPSVEGIRAQAFYNCTSLKIDVNLPKLSGVLEWNEFRLSGITSFTAPMLTKIGIASIAQCPNLTSVNIEKVTHIGANALYENANLSTVNAPSLLEVSAEAFLRCTSLVTIDFKKVTSMGSGCFQGCTSLESVDISSLPDIPNYAFYTCSALKNITLGEVKTIGTYALSSCASLVTIDIKGATSLGYAALYSNKAMTTIIGDELIELGVHAVSGASSLTTINTSKVTSVGDNCFNSCASLESIDLGSAIHIGVDAFIYCTSLRSIGSLDNVVTISQGSFLRCALERVDIGESITSIGDYAFQHNTALLSVVVRATTPPTLGIYVFDNTNNCPIYVPDASVSAYQTATNWSELSSRIKPLSEYNG